MRGGDEDIIPVVDVGIGDGRPTIVYPLYGPCSTVSVWEQNLFAGRAKLPGDEDNGSKAGRRDGAGRFRLPLANDSKAGNWGMILSLLGLSSTMIFPSDSILELCGCG